MLHLCAVFIGYLCVPADYDAVAHFSSMIVRTNAFGQPLVEHFDPTEAKRRGVEIHAWSSDSIRIVSPLGLDRICSRGWCVYYRKHCDAATRSCIYAHSEPFPADGRKAWAAGVVIANTIDIHASSKAALAKLRHDLRFIIHLNSENDFVSVPLTALNRESPDITNFRDCMRSIWVEGCGPPELPERRAFEHP
jgi:hypothetical protein